MDKVVIGLDIGIASVGWAITNSKNLKIIEHGSRLFNTVDANDGKLENEKRREMRSARRQKNRRQTLKRDFIKFLIDQKYITNVSFDKKGNFVNKFRDLYINDAKFNSTLDKKFGELSIFELRKLGMKEALGKKELIKVLLWYVNHRGFKYEEVQEKEDKELTDIKNKLQDNQQLPVFIQTTFYEENGFLNGALNRIFKHSEYVKELKLIFDNQNLTNQFKTYFIEKIFGRQRSFEDGPGSEKAFSSLKNVSKFSRFKVIDGKLVESENMWADSIGKCTYMHEEDRAPKVCLTSEIFNLLNDLNNISVDNQKLDKNFKLKLIEYSVKTKANSNGIIKMIIKEYDLDSDNKIKGYRIDGKGKPLFTPLVSVHLIKKDLKQDNILELIIRDGIFINNNIFDNISKILNETKLLEKRIKKLEKSNLDTNLAKIALGNFSKTHSLSFKAMQLMIPILIETNDNQMTIAHKNGWKDKKMEISQGKHIDKKWIDKIIDTPTVKRSLRQTINVLNAIFDYCKKNHLVIADIVVEMARENNNKRVKDNERNRQNYFEAFNSQLEKYVIGSNFDQKLSAKTRNKLWLLEQQMGCDAYTGKKISKDDVIRYPGNYDIDHILPYSQTFDNSRNNKVLTSQQNNQKKEQRTPHQWLSQADFAKMKTLWEKWYFNSVNDRRIFDSKEKFEYLTSELDFSKPENQLGFIQRNLVDTRYTTRKVLEVLEKFKETNGLGYKVKTVNGKMTSFARRKMENRRDGLVLKRPIGMGDQFDEKTKKKSRVWHGHHAEDAYIITVLNSFYREQKSIEHILSNPEYRYEKFNGSNKKIEAKINTGYSELVASFDFAREELNRTMEETRFSKMIISRKNTQLFNETLYEGKLNDDGKTISKIVKLSLKDMENKKATELFDIKNKKFSRDKLLMDDNLFKGLKEIFELNSQEKYPFYNNGKFIEIHHINKQSEKIKRIVKSIRYVDGNKNLDEIIFAQDNKSSFYDTMQWVELRVYKNVKDKFVLLPINAINAKFLDGKIFYDQNRIQEQLSLLQVENQNFEVLRKNEHLIDLEGNVWLVNGHKAKEGQLEIKPLKNAQNKRLHKAVNTMIGWRKLSGDILGIYWKKDKLF